MTVKRPDWSREKAFRVDEDGCLLYRGVQSTLGLPIIRVNGRYVTVRRALMAMLKGRPLLSSERISVKCGKGLCCSCIQIVSSRDLTLAALARHHWTDNPIYRKKMWANRQPKWTDAQIDDMRARDAVGEDRDEIAASYGTNRKNLAHIFAYRSRTLHLPPVVRHALSPRRTVCT